MTAAKIYSFTRETAVALKDMLRDRVHRTRVGQGAVWDADESLRWIVIREDENDIYTGVCSLRHPDGSWEDFEDVTVSVLSGEVLMIGERYFCQCIGVDEDNVLTWTPVDSHRRHDELIYGQLNAIGQSCDEKCYKFASATPAACGGYVIGEDVTDLGTQAELVYTQHGDDTHPTIITITFTPTPTHGTWRTNLGPGPYQWDVDAATIATDTGWTVGGTMATMFTLTSPSNGDVPGITVSWGSLEPQPTQEAWPLPGDGPREDELPVVLWLRRGHGGEAYLRIVKSWNPARVQIKKDREALTDNLVFLVDVQHAGGGTITWTLDNFAPFTAAYNASPSALQLLFDAVMPNVTVVPGTSPWDYLITLPDPYHHSLLADTTALIADNHVFMTVTAVHSRGGSFTLNPDAMGDTAPLWVDSTAGDVQSALDAVEPGWMVTSPIAKMWVCEFTDDYLNHHMTGDGDLTDDLDWRFEFFSGDSLCCSPTGCAQVVTNVVCGEDGVTVTFGYIHVPVYGTEEECHAAEGS